MEEDNVPPSVWPLGKVIEIHPGKDGNRLPKLLELSLRDQLKNFVYFHYIKNNLDGWEYV